MKYLLYAIVGVSIVGVFAYADDPVHHYAPSGASAQRFQSVAGLAGHWEGTKTHDGKTEKATVTYKVTANGSAVMETLFPGTHHEMITMYTLHGDDLMLTHYCALGNQPSMKAIPSADTKTVHFMFTNGGNMKSENDMHMHELKLSFTSADHFVAEWMLYQDGKPLGPTVLDLKRKK